MQTRVSFSVTGRESKQFSGFAVRSTEESRSRGRPEISADAFEIGSARKKKQQQNNITKMWTSGHIAQTYERKMRSVLL